MRTLVTGASGLVGSAAVAALAARGHTVRAFVNRRPAPDGVAGSVVGDVCDASAWRRALDGIDTVVHAAGAMAQDAALLGHTNVRGTEVACAAARAAGVATFVLISSAAVYAPGPMVAGDEDTPVGPADAYGQSKLAGERLARAALGDAVTILRPASVFAADRPSPIVDALRAIVTSWRIPVVTAGDTPIDLVHAADLALAIAAAAEGRGRGGVFNVAGREPAPFLDLLRRAGQALAVTLNTAAASDATRAEFSPWLYEAATVPRTVSCTRAHQQLGCAPGCDWRQEITRALTPPGA